MKILNFTVAGRAIKLKSVKFYYLAAKILSCFDSINVKSINFFSLNNLDKP